MSKRIAFEADEEKAWIDISEQTWKKVGDGLMNGDTVGESLATLLDESECVGSDDKVNEWLDENTDEEDEE